MIRTAVPAFLALATAASAQVTPVCVETFDYPIGSSYHQSVGGTGWSNGWWVEGANNDDYLCEDNSSMPMFPASDGIGGHATQLVSWASCYRMIDLLAQPDLYDNATDMWGRDGATIWVSFRIMRYGGANLEGFGGLSLWKAGQAQAEALFLGTPWNENKWGLDDEGGIGAPAEVVAVPTMRSPANSSIASTSFRGTSECACGSIRRRRIR